MGIAREGKLARVYDLGAPVEAERNFFGGAQSVKQGAIRVPSAKLAPPAAVFFRGEAGLGGAETRLVGGWGFPGRPGIFSVKADGAVRYVDRGVTFARENRAAPICPRA